jgi:hypothetical protein
MSFPDKSTDGAVPSPVRLLKDVVGVKLEILEGRACPDLIRFANQLTSEFVIILAVLELFADAWTDKDAPVLRIEGHVSLVKQSMEITAHQQAIPEFMSLNHGIGLDVRCLQHRKGALPTDGTTPNRRPGGAVRDFVVTFRSVTRTLRRIQSPKA